MQNNLSITLKKLNIKLALFDVDDTLVETYNHFVTARENLKQELATACNVGFEEISTLYDQLNQQAKELYHVDPTKIWDFVFNGIKLKYPTANTALLDQYQKDYVKTLYQEEIPLKPGVIELLKAFKEAGIHLGIVTNAEADWTFRKLEAVGITHYFEPSRIFIIPPNQKKDLEHWQDAMQAAKPQTVMVFGDNFPVDILPCIKLGAIAVFVNDPTHLPPAFSQGYTENEHSTIRISSYSQLVLELEKFFKIKGIRTADPTLSVK